MGENVKNTIKLGATEEKGGGTKILKMGGGQAGSRTVPLDVSPPCSVLVNNA